MNTQSNFAFEIVEQVSSDLMGSLDIDSHFNNIPLEICTNYLFKNNVNIQVLKKSEFKDLLSWQQKSRILHLIIYCTNKRTE